MPIVANACTKKKIRRTRRRRRKTVLWRYAHPGIINYFSAHASGAYSRHGGKKRTDPEVHRSAVGERTTRSCRGIKALVIDLNYRTVVQRARLVSCCVSALRIYVWNSLFFFLSILLICERLFDGNPPRILPPGVKERDLGEPRSRSARLNAPITYNANTKRTNIYRRIQGRVHIVLLHVTVLLFLFICVYTCVVLLFALISSRARE